nr:zinc finger, CCHC-type [Tanacetum cinerariifolium]
MASNFAKLEKFEGVDFRRWQKKIHFLLSSMSVVYVLTTPMPDDGCENSTVEQAKRRAKWDNDNYVCRGLILNGMSDSLFDVYQNVETSKELWDTLEAKYLVGDALSKKFFDESIHVSCIIDKLPPSWKDFKHTLKYLKDELTQIELGSYLRIEESLRVQDSGKPKGNNVDGPLVVNMVEHNNSYRYNDNKGKQKHHDTKANPNKKPKVTCWKCGKPGHLKRDCKGGNIGNKANGSGTKATVHVCKDRCWLKTYESLNDGSILHMGNESIALVHGRGCVDLRFYVIKPNESVLINSIIELKDVIFDENKFSSVPRPSQRSLINKTEDIVGSVVLEEITEEVVVQQPEPELRKIKRNRTPKNVEPEFQLLLIKRSMDEKEAINDEMDSIISNNTRVLGDVPSGFKPLCCKWIFKRKLKYHRIADCFGITLQYNYSSNEHEDNILKWMLPSGKKQLMMKWTPSWAITLRELEEEVYMNQPLGFIMLGNENKLMPNKGLAVSQLEYSRVIGCLMYAMTCTRPGIAFVVGKVSRLLVILVTLMQAGSATLKTIRLQVAGYSCLVVVQFLRLPRSKLISLVQQWNLNLCPDSAATLAKAYSQMYNEKSRHLSVRHIMIRELIMNGVLTHSVSYKAEAISPMMIILQRPLMNTIHLIEIVRAKELFTWTLFFLKPQEMVYTSDGDSVQGDKSKPDDAQLSDGESDEENDVDGVSETVFGENSSSHHVSGIDKDIQQSEDPFCVYDLLKKHHVGGNRAERTSLSHPLDLRQMSRWFIKMGGKDDTIANDVEKEKMPSVHANVMNTNIKVTEWSIGELTSIRIGPVHNGGSILDVLEDMVRVGHSIGYNLEGFTKDIESIIGAQGVKEVFK